MALTIVDSGLDFTPMHERMDFYVKENILSCCATVVMQGTKIVDYKTFGYMNVEDKSPLQEDAIYRMYSNTKLVTSVALMMLYEQGLFKLDDPLGKFMPDFSDMQVLTGDATSADDVVAAKNPILISHILSHSAGLSYGFIEPDSVIDQAYNKTVNVLGGYDHDLEAFCADIAKLPLAYEPGTSWRYSVATDVCARLVEVLSGQNFDEFLRAKIFTPLAMHDTDFWVPPEKASRFTTMYAPTDIFQPMASGLVKADDSTAGQYNQPRKWLSGGGGLVSTVSDYVSFLQMLILKEQTLALMRTNQLAEGVTVAFPMWAMPGTVFGLGFALKESLQEGDPVGAQGEYHWGGMAGTHSWMAPEADLTGFCLTQRMPGFWHPFSHEFKAHAYAIAGKK
jgi:CubicO group peptidase (beta-lactamase class C family)